MKAYASNPQPKGTVIHVLTDEKPDVSELVEVQNTRGQVFNLAEITELKTNTRGPKKFEVVAVISW